MKANLKFPLRSSEFSSEQFGGLFVNKGDYGSRNSVVKSIFENSNRHPLDLDTDENLSKFDDNLDKFI